MRSYFQDLNEAIGKLIHPSEFFSSSYSGEITDFCRLNSSRVRQAGTVEQHILEIHLYENNRHAASTSILTGNRSNDLTQVKREIESLRAMLPFLPDDPHLLYATKVNSTEFKSENRLDNPREIINRVLARSKGYDLVGIFASGAMYRGFANAAGQLNWYESYSFNFDWSLYVRDDKAAKSSYAGFRWDDSEFERRFANSISYLEALGRPEHKINPGKYRAYLAPQALSEILGILCWGGFGLKSIKTKSSPLLRLTEGVTQLHKSVTLRENTAGGLSPNFDNFGFIRPDSHTLIQDGQFSGPLISARSAKEYGVDPTGTSEGEAPSSLDLAAGSLGQADILHQLDTGVFINNLWYLNYSDRVSCRITGMTRFASFWVENGKIAGPLSVMRFDDTLYNILGEQLVALTKERSFLVENGTYSQRSTGSQHLPGAILANFQFTL